jgi:DNA-binding NarL/FixJ family response regulator
VRERKICVLIVEHKALLRDGLSLLIQGQPDLELVGTTGSCEEAVELFVQHRPDVTLMDLDLPDAAGITTLRRILQRDPATCVLGLVTYEEDVARERALRAGARGCITKDRLNQDLVGLIRDCSKRPG